jgi:alkylation response protein AidB-like acyl-CoA dehydrogenase
MDPRDTPEEAAFRAEVRGWLERTVPPYRDAYRKAKESEERLRIAADWQGELFESGYGAMGWPEEYGGRPGSGVQRFIVAQESAEAETPYHLNMSVTLGWSVPALLAYGTEEQKQAHVAKMLHGEEVWCQLFSEPNAGSDLAAMTTTGRKIDGEWIVNGQKIWSSGAHWASWGILVIRTDPDGPRYRNLTFFIVDMSAPGVEVRPITQITGEQDFCEVFFTDVRIPDAWRVGDENMGWQVAIYTLLNERISLTGGGMLLRLAKMAWEGLLRAARDYERDGRPAIEDPRVRQKLAQIYVDSKCAQWTAMRSLRAFFRGEMPGPEASILKLTGDAWAQRAQEAASDIVGPYATLMDGPHAPDEGAWARGLLLTRAMTIGGGTTEVQKNIVGERVLGLPKEPKARSS